MGESTISLTGQSLGNNLSVALKKISSALHLKREFKKIVCSHSIDFVSFRNCPWMLFIMPIFPKYKTLMYQSVPSLSIPPGQYPRPIFLMGEFLTPRARKEFKTPPPGPIKRLKPHPWGIFLNYYLARRSLSEIINSTLVYSFIDGLQIGGTLFRTCIRLKSKQRESGASQSPCFSQIRSEMRLCLFLQKEMR